jgi:hypothetical protein
MLALAAVFKQLTPASMCIAAITQHIPDQSFQLARYQGW